MRRVLTILSAIALLLVSLGIGVFTADLPFWRRALQLPLAADAVYLPVATIGAPAGDGAAAIPVALAQAQATDPRPHFDATTLEEVAIRARSLGARALLVSVRGELTVERYFVADDARSLLPATVIARPLAAMAVGLAIADGRIRSLDEPVATWLPEWEGETRGRITLRQLLEETSGLEAGGDVRGLLRSAPLADFAALPRFATARGVRMLLGNDYESSALAFGLAHEPGGFRNESPANTQLAALIVERAAAMPYEKFLDARLWRPLRGGHAELQMDRRAGMPAAHCCWRATARDMLRVAELLATDGKSHDAQILPPGWVAEMARPSRVSAGTGLQVDLLRLGGEEAFEIADEEGSALWVIPARQLTILHVGSAPDAQLRELPARLLSALAG